jgi:hypothetical protein
MVLVDYLIVARAGRAVRATGLSLGMLSDESLARCRRLARRQRMDPETTSACMDSAAIFWLAVAGLSVLLLVSSALLAPHGPGPLWIRALPFLLFSFMFVTSASSYGVALVRSMSLGDDPPTPRGRTSAVRAARRTAAPRARDFFLCCAFGVFMTVLAASQIPFPRAST